ncbi:MAG: hypothetical protein QME51_11255 [Planctomycetota bacterium]|nr:hypothetical protein [Planctomycetota bacterium]MDI6788939.1 hypothetical protein [Planctomycetota bacterium]
MKTTAICFAILTVGVIIGSLPIIGTIGEWFQGNMAIRYRHIAVFLGIIALMVVTMVLAIRADKKE